ncbi:MAG: hypothetical protein ACP5LI_05920 [Hydrogenobaculum sp.]
MIISGLIAVIIAFLFAYLYTNEKEFILRWVWLFISLMIIIYASTQDYELAQTTYTSTNGITTYTYAATNNLIPIAQGVGIVLIALVAYFIYMLIRNFSRRGL